MDFLDSLDLDTTNKRSDKVRSWYLYEQYKSLERSQLDAAQKLKDRSYQEKILLQELNERRARRKLYDRFGLCESQSRVVRSIKSAGPKSTSNDEFFESFCELHDDDDNSTEVTDYEIGDPDDVFSHDEESRKDYTDDFKNFDDNRSYAESVTSVLENVKSNNNLADDIKEELELVKKNIAENINRQKETVKESAKCMEKYSKLYEDKKPKDEKVDSSEKRSPNKAVGKTDDAEHDNNIYMVWSKLVSFAYQVMQLNRGNCYYDYSSQMLTAVLACDVLRRGVNKMSLRFTDKICY